MRTVFLLFAALLAAVSGQAQYSFSILDVPGATHTEVYGISGNNVVGYFSDGAGTHGFLYNGATFSTLNVTGALKTYATGISGGAIAGYYQDTGGTYRGFIYALGAFTTNLTAPGGVSTFFWGIQGNRVAGYYGNHGFIYDGSTFAPVDVPGTSQTTVLGIGTSGVVGYYQGSTGQSRGFFYDGNSFTTNLNYPGALLTQAFGIENQNIVGWYLDTTVYQSHGFVYNGGTYTSLDAPGASATYGSGISGNTVAGYCQIGSVTHGFIATVSAATISLKLSPSGTNIVLQWTNNPSGYSLQAGTNLTLGSLWSNVSTMPVLVNGEWIVTNKISGQRTFFRLAK